MRLSSSFIAPSAVAVLSTVLLCGPAASQTAPGSAAPLPSITVEAPKQVARPHGRSRSQTQRYLAGHRQPRKRQPLKRQHNCIWGGSPSWRKSPAIATVVRIKPSTRQRPLGWVSRVGGRTNNRTFLGNVQRQPQLQILCGLRRDQNIPGRVPKSTLVGPQPAGRREVSSRRTQATETAALSHTSCRLNASTHPRPFKVIGWSRYRRLREIPQSLSSNHTRVSVLNVSHLETFHIDMISPLWLVPVERVLAPSAFAG